MRSTNEAAIGSAREDSDDDECEAAAEAAAGAAGGLVLAESVQAGFGTARAGDNAAAACGHALAQLLVN